MYRRMPTITNDIDDEAIQLSIFHLRELKYDPGMLKYGDI